MACLVPSMQESFARSKWLNAGEVRVAKALADLDDGWTVYVQPRLGMDIPDLVALHDRYGVCAIEVKDWAFGKYRNTNGVVEYRDGIGWKAVEQHPRLQASRYRSAMFENSFAQPEDGRPVPPSVRLIVVLLNHPTKQAEEVLRVSRNAPDAQNLRQPRLDRPALLGAARKPQDETRGPGRPVSVSRGKISQ